MTLRNASAPVRALRKLLSHHEIATLLLLLYAPIDAMAMSPDVASLSEYGYVEIVPHPEGNAIVRLTEHGNAVLRGLGVQ